MAIAAATFVYNETINLPIWIAYYGGQFGYENLFVLDRGSDDGSTSNLGAVNVIRLPREQFDEHAKTTLMSSFHASLTTMYEAAIITDCDEILVADPVKYANLNDYIQRMPTDYVNAVGLDIVHLLNSEYPLDLSRPILPQRRKALFSAPESKHLLSKVPISWLPGLHSSNKRPQFDPQLFIFHLKLMDYSCAMQRQKINLETTWSEASLARNYGAHHRFDLPQFVFQSFLVPMDVAKREQISAFNFDNEIAQMMSGTVVDAQGNFRVPMNVAKKLVEIPERFCAVF